MSAAAVAQAPVDEAERRRRVRRSAILFAVIAAAFYFGFIATMLMRAAR
ncbi:MAG TPA: hypothetical protein VEC59_04465 [Steroidobacteraceae bacterium]|nr:hypothetical protein [Steroidobacteraceae bacterium]